MLFYVLILTILRFAFCVNSAVLPRDPERQMSPVGNEGLAKRFPANSITGYPVTGDCSGGDHYTWSDLAFETCYSLPSNVPLSSAKITDFSEQIFFIVYRDNTCDVSEFTAILAATTGEDKCYGVGYEFAAFAIFPITAKSFPLLRHFANGQ